MKTLIVLFLSILPTLSIAQCSLDIPDGVLTSAPLSSLVSEFNPSSFARDDVTYLCYSRADSDNTTFDAIRISLLFTHGSTQYSIRLSYMCRSPNWRYDSSWAATLLSAADHIATNMTIEGCTSCADSSTESFGSPTGCTGESGAVVVWRHSYCVGGKVRPRARRYLSLETQTKALNSSLRI